MFRNTSKSETNMREVLKTVELLGTKSGKHSPEQIKQARRLSSLYGVSATAASKVSHAARRSRNEGQEGNIDEMFMAQLNRETPAERRKNRSRPWAEPPAGREPAAPKKATSKGTRRASTASTRQETPTRKKSPPARHTTPALARPETEPRGSRPTRITRPTLAGRAPHPSVASIQNAASNSASPKPATTPAPEEGEKPLPSPRARLALIGSESVKGGFRPVRRKFTATRLSLLPHKDPPAQKRRPSTSQGKRPSVGQVQRPSTSEGRESSVVAAQGPRPSTSEGRKQSTAARKQSATASATVGRRQGAAAGPRPSTSQGLRTARPALAKTRPKTSSGVRERGRQRAGTAGTVDTEYSARPGTAPPIKRSTMNPETTRKRLLSAKTRQEDLADKGRPWYMGYNNKTYVPPSSPLTSIARYGLRGSKGIRDRMRTEKDVDLEGWTQVADHESVPPPAHPPISTSIKDFDHYFRSTKPWKTRVSDDLVRMVERDHEEKRVLERAIRDKDQRNREHYRDAKVAILMRPRGPNPITRIHPNPNHNANSNPSPKHSP
mmetsp:Transcript_22609/g.70017  ORF Transcript_22609/g.70017 Transcript_22609/m.70017 type:complete len:552 (+) Transcript_22609:117-1772(+)